MRLSLFSKFSSVLDLHHQKGVMIRSALLDKLVFWLNGGRFHNRSRNNIVHRPGAPKIAFLALQLQAEQFKFQKTRSNSIELENRLGGFLNIFIPLFFFHWEPKNMSINSDLR